MKLNRWIKIILISGCVVSLAACASKRKCCSPDDLAVNDANSAYCANNDPQSSGLGEDSRFGDQAMGRMASNNKRTYYFDFDSNVVHDADKPAIIANAKKLAANHSMKAMLEGHTDPRGSREYNIGLGERRAKAVAQIMASQGVNRDQIRVVSYGAEKLASSGRSESDYQQDRRGVLVYTKE